MDYNGALYNAYIYIHHLACIYYFLNKEIYMAVPALSQREEHQILSTGE
jgi:hypothetical protein